MLWSPHWHTDTKVGQAREPPGRQTACVRHTMPGQQSVSSVLSANQTLHFLLGTVCLLQRPDKGQRACADKEGFISHLNNENPNRSAASAQPSSFFHQAMQHIFCMEAVVLWCLHPVIELFALWENCIIGEFYFEGQKQSTRQCQFLYICLSNLM